MINNDITGIPGGNADMLKRPIIFFILAALILAVAGCGENSLPADETTAASDITVSEDQMPVLDRNGAVIGGIDSRALCTAADAGIFYSVFVPGEYEFTADAEYRFFNKEDGTDSLLGTLEGQGYEAYYTRTELDGRIYTLAIKGRPGNDSVPLMLLARLRPISENDEDLHRLGERFSLRRHGGGGRKAAHHESRDVRAE